MKIIDLFEARISELYRDETGFIEGKFLPDGTYYIEKIYVNPEFRGTGARRRLMSHVPHKAALLAQPLYDKREPKNIRQLNRDALVNFYKSLGFEPRPDSNDNILMYRN